ncbi:hypothetical protein QAD02_014396 [Eretmocerus hayati]|uniref:Uncharacterized protein n=1 Tax=Eretmocerus hayati TaxID=131215 RepID=A0ACC2P4S9_9HYME|nr:hypothetical protein QAD02_014396 [Eretmocerus hayati]
MTPRKKRRRKYTWQNVGFTKCSKTCGGGFQTSRYICVRQRSRKHVDNSHCKFSLRPSDHTERCNTKPCPPQWESSDWSQCSVTCGNGVRYRKLQCIQRMSDKLQIKVDNDNCAGLAEPTFSLMESCYMPNCNIYTTPKATSISVKQFEPPPRWKVEDWTPCSAKCGNGTRTRVVTCVTFGRICDLKEKPPTEESCKIADCGVEAPDMSGISDFSNDASWLYSAWPEKCSAECGIGTLSRRLYCESFLRNKTCDEDKMPLLNRTCLNSGPCGQWFIGPWTECSSSCDVGIETRDVVCVSRFLGSLKVVHSDNCHRDKPVEKRTCMGPPCNATWFMSDWSTCSRSCGRGIQKREVNCIGPDGMPMNLRELECDENEKPVDWRNCNEKPCDTQIAEETNSVGDTDGETRTGLGCEDMLTDCWKIRQIGRDSDDKCQKMTYKKGCCKACRYYSFLRSNG